MPTYYNPTSMNPEVWEAGTQPEGYLTQEEFERMQYRKQAETTEGLNILKKNKQAEIDLHTDELIAKKGVEFDGQTFDMTSGAQMRWLQLMGGAQAGIIQFPTTIITSNNQPYIIQDAAHLGRFLGAVAGFLQGGVIAAGQMLKARIEMAGNLDELEAIQDTRTNG